MLKPWSLEITTNQVSLEFHSDSPRVSSPVQQAWKVEVLISWGSRQVSHWRQTCEATEPRQKRDSRTRRDSWRGKIRARKDGAQAWKSPERLKVAMADREEGYDIRTKPVSGGLQCSVWSSLVWPREPKTRLPPIQPSQFCFEWICILLSLRYLNKGFQNIFPFSCQFPSIPPCLSS